MAEFLNKIIPNVMARTDIFWESFRDTFIMVGWWHIIPDWYYTWNHIDCDQTIRNRP